MGTAVGAESRDGPGGYCSAAATLSCHFRRRAFMAHMSFTLADGEVKLLHNRQTSGGDVGMRSDCNQNGPVASDAAAVKPAAMITLKSTHKDSRHTARRWVQVVIYTVVAALCADTARPSDKKTSRKPPTLSFRRAPGGKTTRCTRLPSYFGKRGKQKGVLWSCFEEISELWLGFKRATDC